KLIDDIRARGRVPIVCGGTFLWIRALLSGLAEAPPADPGIRARHAAIAESDGRASLHARLTEVDPASASRLAPNDFVRVSRALEAYEPTGRPQTGLHDAHRLQHSRYPARLVGVFRLRAELDRRIQERTAAWLGAGWIEEVRQLIERGYGEARAMTSVGYKQV